MITRLGTAALVTLLAAPAAAKDATPDVRDAASRLTQQLFDALATGDTAPWARSMADDGVIIDEFGRRIGKKEFVAALQPLPEGFSGSIEDRNVHVREYGTTVVLAEVGGTVVCAGWVRYIRGTDFATLWGGSTLPDWRGQGIYKALVRYRAHLALTRGSSLLQVDASEDSRPILQRCGFVAVTTTTPYVHPAPPDHRRRV